ncbi:MAG: hypothetical protein HY658_13305 [Actinobacteria bacterium]|nr:hypothetical protein [Actinomycetota bacterium]
MLVYGGAEPFVLGAGGSRALARLGVTSVTVLREDRAVAVVLEGWSFDPFSAGDAAARALASAHPSRTFLPEAEITLTGR